MSSFNPPSPGPTAQEMVPPGGSNNCPPVDYHPGMVRCIPTQTFNEPGGSVTPPVVSTTGRAPVTHSVVAVPVQQASGGLPVTGGDFVSIAVLGTALVFSGWMLRLRRRHGGDNG